LTVFAMGTLRMVEASPSCPSTANFPPSFNQACLNVCSTGSDAGHLVGPYVLSSGEPTPYDVAGFYFGHQN
jgi:hypothetical protein